jgi:hypothetical protein
MCPLMSVLAALQPAHRTAHRDAAAAGLQMHGWAQRGGGGCGAACVPLRATARRVCRCDAACAGLPSRRRRRARLARPARACLALAARRTARRAAHRRSAKSSRDHDPASLTPPHALAAASCCTLRSTAPSLRLCALHLAARRLSGVRRRRARPPSCSSPRTTCLAHAPRCIRDAAARTALASPA